MISTPSHDDLLKRIEKLEQEVAALKGEPLLVAAPPAPGGIPEEKTVLLPPPLPPAAVTFPQEGRGAKMEGWLAKAGIALLLMGVVFLFKYSVDQGWITPGVRLLFGMGLGLGLIVWGYRLRHWRKVLSATLQGGGLAAWYGCVYAGFHLYGMIGQAGAVACIVGVTMCGMVLATRLQLQTLSIVATVGGLLSVLFLQFPGELELPAAMVIILGLGSGLLAYRFGWAVLALVTAIFAFITMAVGGAVLGRDHTWNDQLLLQAALVVWALGTWGALLLRKVKPGWLDGTINGPASIPDAKPVAVLHVLAYLVPMFGLFGTAATWDLNRLHSGFLILVVGVLWVVLGRLLFLGGFKDVAATHRLVGLLLAVTGILFTQGEVVAFPVLAVAAWAFLFLSRKYEDRGLEVWSHVLYLVLACWLMIRLFETSGIPFANLRTVVDFVALVSLWGAWKELRTSSTEVFYWLAGMLASVAVLTREAGELPEGQVCVTALWACCSVGLLVASLRGAGKRWRYAGWVLLGAASVKLLLVDLATVGALWRIVLFMGMGGLFIGLSYCLPKLEGPKEGPPPLP